LRRILRRIAGIYSRFYLRFFKIGHLEHRSERQFNRFSIFIALWYFGVASAMQSGFLNFYSGALSVLQSRADLIADNVANADTPNYKAEDLNFDSALAAQLTDPDTQAAPEYRADGVVGLNGNDVSLDSERVEAAANGQAMMGAATFLRQSTSDLLTALRPNAGGI
jgi:flagellar basal-body rod protein FlgB